MVATWRAAPPKPKGLEGIQAEVLLMPCDSDAYFRAEEVEALNIPNATVRPLISPYGHRAGDPWRDEMRDERAFLHAEVGRFLRTRAEPHAFLKME